MNKQRFMKMLSPVFAGVIVTAIAYTFAGLLMLGWNVVGVEILSIATPISFLTALKGVGILYGLLIVMYVTKMIVQTQIQKVQMQIAVSAMKKFEKEIRKTQETQGGEGEDPPDLMRHFR